MKHSPPAAGGSYLRDRKTGRLTPNRPAEPEAPATDLSPVQVPIVPAGEALPVTQTPARPAKSKTGKE